MAKKVKRPAQKGARKTDEADEISSFLQRARSVFLRNWKPLALGIALVVVIVAGILFWMRNLEKSEAYASFLLSQGMTAINRADNLTGEEANSAYQEALEVLKDLVEEYGFTDSGELGVFFIGKCLSRLKRYGEAAEQYEEFLKLNPNEDDPLYRSLAIQSLGFVYQHEKEFEKALACFNELVQIEGSFLRGEALLGLARIHEEMGQHEKALAAYREFLTSYPDSTEVNRIQRRLALFEERSQ